VAAELVAAPLAELIGDPAAMRTRAAEHIPASPMQTESRFPAAARRSTRVATHARPKTRFPIGKNPIAK